MARTVDKARENRLRRKAKLQGLILRKSARRDQHALDYGIYWLISPESEMPVTSNLGISLDAVEKRLTSRRRTS